MDWVAGDFTQVYADTFVTPLGAQGLYVQEDAEPPCYQNQPVKEGFGNFPLVNRGGRHGRVMREIGRASQEPLPYTGPLLPAERLRPRGGGPAPSEAYPLMTQSEGMDRPYALSVPAPTLSQSRDGFAPRPWGLSGREAVVGIAAALVILSVVLAALAIGHVLFQAPRMLVLVQGLPRADGGGLAPQSG
jgi:hypothetical protein